MRLTNIKDVPDHIPSTSEMVNEAIHSLFHTSPLTLPPSSSVFLNRTQKSVLRYLLLAILLLLAGFGISYGGESLTYIGFIIAGYAVPILFLVYFIRRDKYEPEPIALIAYCFGWGAFSGVLAGIFNAVITARFIGAGGAGFVEEPIKIIGVYWLARNSRLKNEFNDHLDGMVYGAAAGAGFAGLENFWYITQMIFHGSYPVLFAILVRSFTGVMHILWCSIAGRSLGLAKAMKGSISREDLIPGTLIAAVLHSLWNIAPTVLSICVVFPFTINAVRNMINTAVQDETNWGYGAFAPDEKE
jgi:RsiW-degrading membrane proteinase PrsW (M82 family)